MSVQYQICINSLPNDKILDRSKLKAIADDTLNIGLVGYFRLFIIAFGCPSVRQSSRRRLLVAWDSSRIQDETSEGSAWFFNVLGV